MQILSLGAGTDTRFFRLVHRDSELARRLCYHEVDFPVTTSKKIQAIERSDFVYGVLKAAVGEGGVQIAEDKKSLTSKCYTIHGLDLRQLAAETFFDYSAQAALDEPSNSSKAKSPQPSTLQGLDAKVPTLVLSECFLSYLDADISTQLLTKLVRSLLAPTTPLQFLFYEPLKPATPFGRTMLENLASRSISLPGLEAFPTLESHFGRLRKLGFDHCEGEEIGNWWKDKVDDAEKERLWQVEGLDEEEEWQIMSGQWGTILASRDRNVPSNESSS